jgi:hypothetical protein
MRHLLVLCMLVGCGKSEKGLDNVVEQKGGVARVSEAQLHLDSIAKRAKAVYAETGKFPIGTSSVLPARNGDSQIAGGCCGSKSVGVDVDHKCAVSKDWASDPVWKALGFSIDDTGIYRYKYESADGKTFVATATGDVDCDSQEAVFTAKGTVADGKPTVELVKPEKGVY